MIREDGDFPVLIRTKYLNGNVYILNVPENSYDLFRLPEEILNAIREIFLSSIDVCLNGNSKIGLYVFEDNLYVIYNMNSLKAKASLKMTAESSGKKFQELLKGKKIRIRKSDDHLELHFQLDPYEILAIEGK